MPQRYYANAPATALAAACTALATSIEVDSTAGLPISYPYTLILDKATATEEAVSVTAAASTTLTVTRGIDGTTAFAHTLGATVEHGITAQDIREANDHVNDTAGVHGATGAVVGTTDAQVLTNKDLTSETNDFPESLVTLTDTQTLTNKTLTAPTLTTPEMSDPVATGSLEDFGGAWQNWTLAGTLGVTFQGGYIARYTVIGKTCFGFFKGVVAANIDSTNICVNLPLTARAGYDIDTTIGTGIYHNPGVHRSALIVGLRDTSYFNFWWQWLNNANLTAVSTGTPDGNNMSGDEIISATFTYEIA